jgi:biotin transporter BioY
LQYALATGLYPFIVPDLIKLAIAAGFVPALWRVIGRTNVS